MLFYFIMNPLDYEQLELTHYRSSRSKPLTETLFFSDMILIFVKRKHLEINF